MKAKVKPEYIFGLTIFYLMLTWFISYLVDIVNVFNLQHYLFGRFSGTTLLWYHIFKEGGITEVLQWSFLGGTILFCGINAGRLYEKGSKQTLNFFLFLGVGAILMLMEDGGNVRHNLKEYPQAFLGNTILISIAVELIFYAFLGLIMMIALLKYRRYIWGTSKTRFYLITGYIAYAAASIASATRDLNFWYFSAGHWIHHTLLGGDMYERSSYYINFLIMDCLIEESIELIGAAALFTAVYAYFIHPGPKS